MKVSKTLRDDVFMYTVSQIVTSLAGMYWLCINLANLDQIKHAEQVLFMGSDILIIGSAVCALILCVQPSMALRRLTVCLATLVAVFYALVIPYNIMRPPVNGWEVYIYVAFSLLFILNSLYIIFNNKVI